METSVLLLDAAEAEFNSRGFHGTDSNRIARRAGFAPQTFYRHYADKMAIFLAVYERWWRAEIGAIANVASARAKVDVAKVADTMLAFHMRWRIFRRSLRHLAVEDNRVRAARAVARKAQIAAMKPLVSKRDESEIAAALLVFERLCDAAAEGEFTDMGLAKTAAREVVIASIRDAIG
jgi:AcrR family transcriptional regulator